MGQVSSVAVLTRSALWKHTFFALAAKYVQLPVRCRLLPEAEQAKHADTMFRYLFKVDMLSLQLRQPKERAAYT